MTEIVPIIFDVFGYHIPKFSVHCSRLANCDGFLKTLISLGDQKLARFSHIANQISLVQIHIHSIFEDSDVQVDDVPVFQRSAVGNPVANDLVD